MVELTSPYTLVVERAPLPIVIVHGGAGSYLQTTTAAQRAIRGARLVKAAELGLSLIHI